MAMSTSASILTTATMDRSQNAGSSHSTVSVQTRRTMSMATRALLDMTGAANAAPDLPEEGGPVGVVTGVVTAEPRLIPASPGLLVRGAGF
jgi:uncharacterized protein YaaW (UPF0174 family)